VGARQVGGQVKVAEAEPGGPAQLLDLFDGTPRFAITAPAGVGVGDAGQRVGDGVNVGANCEAEVLEVVAGVDDDGEVAGRKDLRQTVGQLGAADAAGEEDDLVFIGLCGICRRIWLLQRHGQVKLYQVFGSGAIAIALRLSHDMSSVYRICFQIIPEGR